MNSSRDLINVLLEGCQIYVNQLTEYAELALRPELTEQDAERLDKIYAEAEKDCLLNFFINELDDILNTWLGLLNHDVINCYADQQAWLREHLEQIFFDYKRRKEMQRLLRQLGIYDGPIDGVLGKRSAEALEKCCELQTMLQEQGFYDRKVDGYPGEHTVKAVKQFQKTHELKDDGIPGNKTFSALQAKR